MQEHDNPVQLAIQCYLLRSYKVASDANYPYKKKPSSRPDQLAAAQVHVLHECALNPGILGGHLPFQS